MSESKKVKKIGSLGKRVVDAYVNGVATQVEFPTAVSYSMAYKSYVKGDIGGSIEIKRNDGASILDMDCVTAIIHASESIKLRRSSKSMYVIVVKFAGGSHVTVYVAGEVRARIGYHKFQRLLSASPTMRVIKVFQDEKKEALVRHFDRIVMVDYNCIEGSVEEEGSPVNGYI